MNTLYVITKDGLKVSGPLSESEANAEASKLRILLESKGEKSVVKVVPMIMG